MIIRKQYRGSIQAELSETDIRQALERDAETVRSQILAHRCLTAALYRYENMVFLYYEAVEAEQPDEHEQQDEHDQQRDGGSAQPDEHSRQAALQPTDLFPALSDRLQLWPEKEGSTPWAYMYQIYYHSIPQSSAQWARSGVKKRRGRIAYLHADKLFSYTYWHHAIVQEGLFEGDQYQSIALHENVLFSYFEEPKIFTHINRDVQQKSSVIDSWIAADPESHFDHSLSGEDNFLMIEELFSMGAEDVL